MVNRILELVITLLALTIIISVSCTGCIHRHYRVRQVPDVQYIKYYNTVTRLISLPSKEFDPQLYNSHIATGFAVGEDLILTAGHFCKSISSSIEEGRSSDKILLQGAQHNGNAFMIGLASIAAISDTYDICLLVTESVHHLNVLPIAPSMLGVETEDKITIIGAPSTFFPIRREGTISQVSGERIRGRIFLAVDVQKGNSGSPVIWNNQIIGIITEMSLDVHNAGIAENANSIREFLSEYIERD